MEEWLVGEKQILLFGEFVASLKPASFRTVEAGGRRVGAIEIRLIKFFMKDMEIMEI